MIFSYLCPLKAHGNNGQSVARNKLLNPDCDVEMSFVTSRNRNNMMNS